MQEKGGGGGCRRTRGRPRHGLSSRRDMMRQTPHMRRNDEELNSPEESYLRRRNRGRRPARRPMAARRAAGGTLKEAKRRLCFIVELTISSEAYGSF